MQVLQEGEIELNFYGTGLMVQKDGSDYFVDLL